MKNLWQLLIIFCFIFTMQIFMQRAAIATTYACASSDDCSTGNGVPGELSICCAGECKNPSLFTSCDAAGQCCASGYNCCAASPNGCITNGKKCCTDDTGTETHICESTEKCCQREVTDGGDGCIPLLWKCCSDTDKDAKCSSSENCSECGCKTSSQQCCGTVQPYNPSSATCCNGGAGDPVVCNNATTTCCTEGDHMGTCQTKDGDATTQDECWLPCTECSDGSAPGDIKCGDPVASGISQTIEECTNVDADHDGTCDLSVTRTCKDGEQCAGTPPACECYYCQNNLATAGQNICNPDGVTQEIWRCSSTDADNDGYCDGSTDPCPGSQVCMEDEPGNAYCQQVDDPATPMPPGPEGCSCDHEGEKACDPTDPQIYWECITVEGGCGTVSHGCNPDEMCSDNGAGTINCDPMDMGDPADPPPDSDPSMPPEF